MTRPSLIAAAALTLAAAPVFAQSAQQTASASAGSVQPGSQEWLRVRGEMYNRAPDSEQNPAEVEATARLNAEIAARNAAAEQSEMDGQSAYEQENARWQAETSKIETQRAQWEADTAAADAARAQWERDRAAWEAEMDACRRSGRVCISAPPQGY
ncbi:Skp family chaperone for outer membrane proteins [Brevundimonas alba]|uniref:Skp family chaperone for outer membrane proteins n=1 Tax=Brevundimonas alba TaxID=74314 RepID=A0A7X6BMI5_9CAUL|nr:cell wall hydrolase [Brevundimonas alba]NJC40387.1 Skp family chaperone for outer membrane proteins [Brevundimonas alba]